MYNFFLNFFAHKKPGELNYGHFERHPTGIKTVFKACGPFDYERYKYTVTYSRNWNI